MSVHNTISDLTYNGKLFKNNIRYTMTTLNKTCNRTGSLLMVSSYNQSVKQLSLSWLTARCRPLPCYAITPGTKKELSQSN